MSTRMYVISNFYLGVTSRSVVSQHLFHFDACSFCPHLVHAENLRSQSSALFALLVGTSTILELALVFLGPVLMGHAAVFCRFPAPL